MALAFGKKVPQAAAPVAAEKGPRPVAVYRIQITELGNKSNVFEKVFLYPCKTPNIFTGSTKPDEEGSSTMFCLSTNKRTGEMELNAKQKTAAATAMYKQWVANGKKGKFNDGMPFELVAIMKKSDKAGGVIAFFGKNEEKGIDVAVFKHDQAEFEKFLESRKKV
jgi:hypothetical protein